MTAHPAQPDVLRLVGSAVERALARSGAGCAVIRLWWGVGRGTSSPARSILGGGCVLCGRTSWYAYLAFKQWLPPTFRKHTRIALCSRQLCEGPSKGNGSHCLKARYAYHDVRPHKTQPPPRMLRAGDEVPRPTPHQSLMTAHPAPLRARARSTAEPTSLRTSGWALTAQKRRRKGSGPQPVEASPPPMRRLRSLQVALPHPYRAMSAVL